MDLKNIDNIKEIIETIDASSIAYFEASFGNGFIKMNKATDGDNKISSYKSENKTSAIKETNTNISSSTATEKKQINYANLKEVKCNVVGAFCASISPKKPPLEVGAKVKKGDILGVVDVLTIKTEIISDFDGEIVEIVAEDGGLVDYGAVLFKIG